mmetsp:Transcript_83/g.299  ORF Transcript_83/g.299 Transcript_83/m.299 type:complete len:413 (+) Transcript_83:77-1315(+)
MAEAWHNQAQQKWSDQLVLCRLRGFPPWPSLVVKPQPRSALQGPMNAFAPPADSVFDREVKCVRRGAGFKPGDTVSAYYLDHSPFGLPALQSSSRQKATVVRIGRTSLRVKFKHDGRVENIPKNWAELNSSSKSQMPSAGMVKKPIGKVRDVALRGKARGKVPAGQVLVYSFGDEMYRKVRVSTLRSFTSENLASPYGRSGDTVESSLWAFCTRGFRGADALREAVAELGRRKREQSGRFAAAQDQAAFRKLHLPEPERFRSAVPGRPPTSVTSLPKVQRFLFPPLYSDASESEESEESEVPVSDLSSFIHSRAQQRVPVRLAGMIVPFTQQLEAGDVGAKPSVSAGQLAEARQLLEVSQDEAADRTLLNRARRSVALKYHPDKAQPQNKEWAHEKWLQVDAAHLLLLSRLA